MVGDRLIEREEDDFHESASRLKTPPYCRCASATIRFRRDVRRRSRTGDITITSPSVETSRGVSASILAWSRRGLSNTSARLFPVFVSFLTMIRTDNVSYPYVRVKSARRTIL